MEQTKATQTVDEQRWRLVQTPEAQPGTGPVVYWMSRDQRAHDNRALTHAADCAHAAGVGLVVLFCLRKRFAHATARVVDFMLPGLAEVEAELRQKHIPLVVVVGDPGVEIPKFIRAVDAHALVADMSPLRPVVHWKRAVAAHIHIPFVEVDAHNVVPVWTASQKQEFGAYTLRPKLHRLVPQFLATGLPQLRAFAPHNLQSHPPVQWKHVRTAVEVEEAVPALLNVVPGPHAARRALDRFIADRLSGYDADRNDPTREGQSGLSPYLHFGQLSAERVVHEVLQASRVSIEVALHERKNGAAGMRGSVSAFIEELVVRRELADNFCFYNAEYDSVKGFPAWARKSLEEHKADAREHVYTLRELELAQTKDELWNAAQLQMMQQGKMHGYLRMYWAKKILEWSATPQTAMRHAIYLNDRYSLDGRDPNGYAGIAWSIGGVHDRAWFERPIFGKIRYMSYGGAKGKFDIKAYIANVTKG